MDKEKRMEFLECLHDMWQAFMKVASPSDVEAIDKFMDAKDKAHELLSKIEPDNIM